MSDLPVMSEFTFAQLLHSLDSELPSDVFEVDSELPSDVFEVDGIRYDPSRAFETVEVQPMFQLIDPPANSYSAARIQANRPPTDAEIDGWMRGDYFCDIV